MIILLTGENSFEVDRALQSVVGAFDGSPERIDGSDVDLKQLPDLLMGTTLFATKRLVIIKNLSLNKAAWSDFSRFLPRISDDVQLVLVESKLDKRTKTYKDLQKLASIQEFTLWGERDTMQAEKWVATEAKRLGVIMDTKSVHTLVMRLGLDQWLLSQALYKLSFVDSVNRETIESLIDAHPTENVFNLFEAALKSDVSMVTRMIKVLSLNEDPFRLFGLLSGQAFQLATLAVADRPSGDIAKDIGAHPFALGKLAGHAKKLGRSGVRQVIIAFTEADSGMKTSIADPWLLIERALAKVAQIQK